MEQPTPTTRPMHPAVRELLTYFRWRHLPAHLQDISVPFARQALKIAEGAQNPEATVALRKLLEAKDAAVRAALPPYEGDDSLLKAELLPGAL